MGAHERFRFRFDRSYKDRNRVAIIAIAQCDGGVTQQTAMDLIRAGATALGIGAELIPHDAVRRRRSEQIVELARRFLGIVREARKLTAPAKELVARH